MLVFKILMQSFFLRTLAVVAASNVGEIVKTLHLVKRKRILLVLILLSC
jgi:hypothetical protein